MLLLAICLAISNSMFYVAQASCATIPDKPLLTYASDPSGVEFRISPAMTGCPATTMSFAYAYYNGSSKFWENWSKWAIGSNAGKSFSFKIPSVVGKTRVAFAVTASNKSGTSASTRENQAGNGVEFQVASRESVFERDVTAGVNSKIGSLQLKMRHPQNVECEVFSVSYSDNCRFEVKYDLATDVIESKDRPGGVTQVIELDIVDEKGIKIGSLTYGIFNYSYSQLSENKNKSNWASAKVKTETRAKFKLKPDGFCDKLCREISSQEFVLTPLSQEEANRRKAASDAKAKQDLEDIARSEAAQLAAKKLTITCVKGKQTKKVIGDPPSCPAGFKNPLSGFATFQAFSNCELYKMDARVGGAQLQDGGRTLILDGVKDYGAEYNSLSDFDYRCAAKVMKMPAYVQSKVGSTRALDGMQNAQWGKISAFWNFHPDNGLDITFTSR